MPAIRAFAPGKLQKSRKARLLVTGDGFTEGSVIRLGGQDVATTTVSSRVLKGAPTANQVQGSSLELAVLTDGSTVVAPEPIVIVDPGDDLEQARALADEQIEKLLQCLAEELRQLKQQTFDEIVGDPDNAQSPCQQFNPGLEAIFHAHQEAIEQAVENLCETAGGG